MTHPSCGGGFQPRYQRDAPTAASASATDFGFPRSVLGFSPVFPAGLKFTRPSAGSRLLGECVLSWRDGADLSWAKISESTFGGIGSAPENEGSSLTPLEMKDRKDSEVELAYECARSSED